MKIKKAIISALILYAVLFLVASVLMFSLSITDDTVFGSIMVVLSSIAVFLIAKEYYFKGIKATPKEGLIVGIILSAIGILIDIPVMVYGFASQMGWGYFMSWHLMLGYLLGVIIPILVAYKSK